MVEHGQKVGRVAFVGTYIPRQCGIATFTSDLCTAVQSTSTKCLVVPLNDRSEGYDYSAPVRFVVFEPDLAGYRRAAEFLNINHVDTVSLQHEYGIFGGKAGSHVLALLQSLRTPVVTTLHTVLNEPDAEHLQVMQQIAALSDRVVVMSAKGQEFLRSVYGVPEDHIDVIPHGIPDIPFVDPNFYKDQFDVAERPVIITFGLLAPSKGLEYVIEALPKIKQAFPNVVYLIVGATHPHCIRAEGEAYRLRLQRLARELDVEKNVMFHNRFVAAEELIEFIGASDIYVTPYLSRDQITSGTLAWAVGAGKAVISTPYWYAEELLGDDRGLLVPFREHQPIADAAIRLLSDDAARHAMRKRAYMYGRSMTWPNVAHQYTDTFRRACAQRTARPRISLPATGQARKRGELPSVPLEHIRRLTDGTGLLQHACYTVPRYSDGYCTDDNGRALILMMRLAELGELPDKTVEDLAIRYLAFLTYAFNADQGRFRNFLSYDNRHWLEEMGSEDSHGRALWALGATVQQSRSDELKPMAGELFERALRAVDDFRSPRAMAFALLGIDEYLNWFSGHVEARTLRQRIVLRLLQLHADAQAPQWHWFEDCLTYSNARLPQALIVTGKALGEERTVNIGLDTLSWLCEVQRPDGGYFVPIGSNGFFVRGKERARFDQQPVEACATISACLTAYAATGDTNWYAEAERTFEWFMGRNDLDAPLYDPRTGGCHDALHAERVNANQGAESTLSYLLSLADMRLADKAIVLRQKDTLKNEVENAVEQPA